MSDFQTPTTTSGGAKPWLWWVIVALVLLNTVSLVFLWMHRGCGPMGCGVGPDGRLDGAPPDRAMMRDDHPRGPAGMRAFEFIAHEVGMNEQQRRAYEDLRDRHHLAMRPIQDSIHDLRQALFNELAQNDDAKRQQQLGTISHLTMLQDSLTVQHFRQVRALLSAEQQQRFDSIIADAARMIAQPAPPPHGDDRPGPGPDARRFLDGPRGPRAMDDNMEPNIPPGRRPMRRAHPPMQ